MVPAACGSALHGPAACALQPAPALHSANTNCTPCPLGRRAPAPHGCSRRPARGGRQRQRRCRRSSGAAAAGRRTCSSRRQCTAATAPRRATIAASLHWRWPRCARACAWGALRATAAWRPRALLLGRQRLQGRACRTQYQAGWERVSQGCGAALSASLLPRCPGACSGAGGVGDQGGGHPGAARRARGLLDPLVRGPAPCMPGWAAGGLPARSACRLLAGPSNGCRAAGQQGGSRANRPRRPPSAACSSAPCSRGRSSTRCWAR